MKATFSPVPGTFRADFLPLLLLPWPGSRPSASAGWVLPFLPFPEEVRVRARPASPAVEEEVSLLNEAALETDSRLPGVVKVTASLYTPCPEPCSPTHLTRTCGGSRVRIIRLKENSVPSAMMTGAA